MKTDFYTIPHKLQRQQLFTLSNLIGEANFDEFTILEKIEKDLFDALNVIKNHALHEETFVHPLLSRKLPRIARTLHQHHLECDQWFVDLQEQFAHLKSLGENYPKCQVQGQALYRLLNGFIAEYLIHMNEEEQTMHSLWELAIEPELKGMMLAFLTHVHKDEAKIIVQDTFKQFDKVEQDRLITTVKLMAPAHVYTAMLNVLQPV